jgi:hypothetical protein
LLAKTTMPASPLQCPRCRRQNLIATEVMPTPEPIGHWAGAL